MRRLTVTWLLFLALGIVMSACAIVTVQYPVGEPVSDEVGKWAEGWWINDNHSYVVTYLTQGSLRIAEVIEEGGQPQLLEWPPALLTEYENVLYLNLRRDNPTADALPEYGFFRVRRQGDRVVVLWTPRREPFANAIRNGELAGEDIRAGDGPSVRLTASKEEMEAFLKGRKPGELFELEEPVVYIRQATP